jgi:hypothetical protein
MDNVYNINWRTFIVLNLPAFLRKTKTIKFLEVIFKPIMWLHLAFLEFRTQALYKVNHNSQICYLQAVLNDSFDSTQRRIIIRNAILREPLWFYEPEENRPVLFYEESDNKPVYFREEIEFVGDGADFLVLVPIDLKPTNTQEENALIIKVEGQINYYKLFVKNYIILWV